MGSLQFQYESGRWITEVSFGKVTLKGWYDYRDSIGVGEFFYSQMMMDLNL